MKDNKIEAKVPLLGDSAMGQRIVFLRRFLRLTQVEFAKKIVVSNGMIAAIELGKRKVNERLLRLIKITFAVNENWLRTGEGDMFEKNTTPDYKIIEVLENFKKLSPRLQDLVLEHLHKLTEYEITVKNN
jgi:transcriptional regulator with XRE-family HTH domain